MQYPGPVLTGVDTSTEMTTRTLSADQTWRQVGWLGQSGRVYSLSDDPAATEPGSWEPLWILAHNEPPVPVET